MPLDSENHIGESHDHSSHQKLTCWLLDTRPLWPGNDISTAAGAAQLLSALSVSEQSTIKDKMFIRDAKMSLGSALLKRTFISHILGISWRDVHIGRERDAEHGKPCAVDANGMRLGAIDFNVSHHGGLVALIGCADIDRNTYKRRHAQFPAQEPSVQVGIDVVQVSDRDVLETIDDQGFNAWLDSFQDIFSERELWAITHGIEHRTTTAGSSSVPAHRIIDRCNRTSQQSNPCQRRVTQSKLRRFYCYFALKEAYTKLVGDGLAASWIQELEFANVNPPKACLSDHPSAWGEALGDVELYLHGESVHNVEAKVQAFEQDFMIATTVRGGTNELTIPPFQELDLKKDLIPIFGI